METECKRCALPEVISGEITLSLREWSLLEKIRFWILMYGKITHFLAKKMFFISVLAVFIMMIPITADVLLRFFANGALPGVIEIEEILMLLMVFAGLGWAKIEGGHIRVDLLYDHFPIWLKNDLAFFHTSLMGTFSLVMTFFMFESTIDKYTAMEMTPDLFLPYWPFFLVASLGSLVLCLCILKQTMDALLDIIASKQFIGMAVFTGLAFAMMAVPFWLSGTAMAGDLAMAGWLVVISLLVILLLRMPIGFAMGITGVLGLIIIMPNATVALSFLSSGPSHTCLSFIMTVVPMFVLMGEVALCAGISSEMFNAASIWLGRLPGGIAVAGVAGCTGFAAICGDSLATAMTMTSVALPEMQKRNYNLGLGCSALASGGTLGILIPPSLGFIMYAIVTEESIGKLFIAGIIPGIILAFLFGLIIVLMALKWPALAPRGEKHSWNEKFRSIIGIIPMLMLIVLIIGGILSGTFSPTEGGAVGAVGTIVYAVIRRKLSFEGFIHSLKVTAGMTSRLMLIFIGVNLLGYFLANTRLPFMLAEWTLSLGSNKYTIFAAIVMLYVILGCLMNVVPMILLTLPAIFPTVQQLGFDPIWFGVVTVILMEMGQITPPMGVVVFAIAGMPNTPPMAQIFKYILPFVAMMFLTIILLTIFPQLATWLPELLI